MDEHISEKKLLPKPEVFRNKRKLRPNWVITIKINAGWNVLGGAAIGCLFLIIL